MSYSLNIYVDHQAPELILEGVENGIAKGPVTISGLEDESILEIFRDDERIVQSEELKTSGTYKLIYSDEAGNSTEYNFVIRVYFDTTAWSYVAAVVLIIAGVIVYMIYCRKHLRLR